jgi:cytosine/adenosine deaminase-related metal-dependent hydrolase
VVRAGDLNMQPVHDPVSSVVLQASLANIDSVMVAGRWKKRDGCLLDVDLAPKLTQLRASGRRIAEALGLAGAAAA